MNNDISIARAQSRFMFNVYGWMSFGLFLTSVVALFAASNMALMQFVFNPWVFWPMLIAQFGLVVYLSAGLNSMSYTAARISFIAYSLLTGLTLSSIFFVYTFSSIAATFLVCSGMFAAMALYGYFTKADLSGMGTYLLMAIFGLVISSIVNYFLQNSMFDFMISIFGVIIFTLLTAYDAQKLKEIAYNYEGTNEGAAKLSIYGALVLYLDFINLFMYLVRLMGRKRD